MKIKLFFLFVLFPLFQEKLTGKVIAVMDGDTIEILFNNEPIRIRLNGIDCPEKSQDFGNKAKQFTSDLCFKRTVTVISNGKNRYGRTLGDVVLDDGRIVNQELGKAGLAWHYKKYSNDLVLSNLEIKAKEQKLGLWSRSDYVAPWEFRQVIKLDLSSLNFLNRLLIY